LTAAADELIGLTRDLVGAPSPNPPGDERHVVARLREHLSRIPGVRLRTYTPAPHRVSLLATAGGSGRSLLLAAHTDTHPVTGDWQHDPLGREPVWRGRIFGRGTTDNKGAVAAMAIAFRRLVAAGAGRHGRILFLANADEETGGGAGVEPIVSRWDERPDAAVVAEASGVRSSWEALYVAARGTSRFTIEVAGTATHSSLAGRPHVRSAVEDLEVLLAAFRERLPLLRRRHARFGPVGRLTVVRIEGGVGWGVVPGRASAQCELRLLPGVEQKGVEAAIRSAFAGVVSRAGSSASLTLAGGGLRWMAPSSVRLNDPIVGSARRAWRATHRKEPSLECFPGATDARLFEAAGIPCVIVGPGALERAHHPDEYVTSRELSSAVNLYEAIAKDFLGMGRAR
jgi:acetylornithine deacetylase/succinyl-diaminopimelate desuccinylase-like protein